MQILASFARAFQTVLTHLSYSILCLDSKKRMVFFILPEIVRLFKYLSGTPTFRVIYNPRLEYAIGETKNYVKNNFIVSIVDDKHYDTLFLYTDFDKDNILSASEIQLRKDHFVTVSYNEKIKVPNQQQTQFEFERTKVYWLNWCHKTPTFSNYNQEILRSAMTLKLMTYEKTGLF